MSGWACVTAGCFAAADCREARGEPCGWYGGDVPVDEVPLPPEPPEDEVEAEPWDPQPIRVEEIPIEDEYRRTPMTVEERAEMVARYERARRVHVAARPRDGLYRRLAEEFDPRGRHVGCDGEPGPAGTPVGGCGVAPGVACRGPRGRLVPGLVHPSRLRSEMLLFGLTEYPVAG